MLEDLRVAMINIGPIQDSESHFIVLPLLSMDPVAVEVAEVWHPSGGQSINQGNIQGVGTEGIQELLAVHNV